jgi:hypothetical protein
MWVLKVTKYAIIIIGLLNITRHAWVSDVTYETIVNLLFQISFKLVLCTFS